MKQILVTGGTSGIGSGICNVLARDGHQIIATGVNPQKLERFNSKSPANVTGIPLDVTSFDQVKSTFSGLEQLDGLVNCAGIIAREKEYEMETFEKVIDVNLNGTMRCCLAAHPLLARSGGAIVNTASMLSYFGGPLVPAYSASKGGVAQLTKALAGRWAGDNIRVNAVAPGWINTPMTEGLQANPQRNEAILARTPQKRWGAPEEIGEAVAWLLSDKASFVTGSIYNVDGGYTAL